MLIEQRLATEDVTKHNFILLRHLNWFCLGDTDSDGDGQVDAADEDDDNDGLLDVEDDDDDGDGVQDEDEDNDGDGLTNDGIVFKFVLHLPWILWCNLFKFKR